MDKNSYGPIPISVEPNSSFALTCIPNPWPLGL